MKRPRQKLSSTDGIDYIQKQKSVKVNTERLSDLDRFPLPNGLLVMPVEELKYSTTNREGYREYKSDPEKCSVCPFKEKCTESKTNQKVVMRHIWEKYIELVEDYRHTPEYSDIYKLRK